MSYLGSNRTIDLILTNKDKKLITSQSTSSVDTHGFNNSKQIGTVIAIV